VATINELNALMITVKQALRRQNELPLTDLGEGKRPIGGAGERQQVVVKPASQRSNKYL